MNASLSELNLASLNWAVMGPNAASVQVAMVVVFVCRDRERGRAEREREGESREGEGDGEGEGEEEGEKQLSLAAGTSVRLLMGLVAVEVCCVINSCTHWRDVGLAEGLGEMGG